jgi:hypothetical protein
MSRNHMTRWIEIADERHFFEETAVGRMHSVDESHLVHLGTTVLKIPSWVPGGVYRRWLPVPTRKLGVS